MKRKATVVNVLWKIEKERPLHQRQAGDVHSRVCPVSAINILATVSQGLYNLPHLAN